MEYLLKASAVIAIFYICYKLFLQRDTFFEINRGFLLAGLITAFALPFIVIPIYVERAPMLLDAYVFNDVAITTIKPKQTFTFLQLLYTIYALGVVFFFVRFLTQLLSLLKLIFTNEREKRGQYTYIKTSSKISPFSFFNWIVYNPDLFNKNEIKQIITHEKVHVKQHHSIDILLMQLSCIALWLNPFVWLYNKDLKQNLEFIADQNAQTKSDCKKSYQYTLLKTSMPTHQLALTNNFYNSLIKKRIVMLHKSKSKKINQLKYALIIPILAVFLMSFNTETVYIEKEFPVIENALFVNPFVEEGIITNDNINKEKEKSETKSNIKKPLLVNTNTQKKVVKASNDIETVIITKNFTEADFEKVKNDLKKSGVTVKFKGIKRNNKAEITAIKIDVISKNANANYSISSDEAIKPIKISFDEDDNSISIGNSTAKHMHGGNTYAIKSNGRKHKIHKTGKGNNVFVFLSDDEDSEIIHADTIHFKNHGKKDKHKVVLRKAEIISDNNDENVEIIIENNNNYEDTKKEKTEFIVTGINNDKSNIRFFVNKELSYDKKPLIIVDGLEVTEERMHNIKPNSIAHVSVLKGDKATLLHGEKAKDGVVIITTKDDKKTFKLKAIGKNDGESKIRISTDNDKEPLYILDGKEIKKDKFEELKPDNIESISVLKGGSAIEKYGDKAKDGVVEITTKKKE